MNDFLKDEHITYALEAIVTHDTHQLTLETRLSGYLEFDTSLMLRVAYWNTDAHDEMEDEHEQ